MNAIVILLQIKATHPLIGGHFKKILCKMLTDRASDLYTSFRNAMNGDQIFLKPPLWRWKIKDKSFTQSCAEDKCFQGV